LPLTTFTIKANIKQLLVFFQRGFDMLFRKVLLGLLMMLSCSLVWANQPPKAVISVKGKTIAENKITVTKNEEICFSGLNSTDPESDVLTYTWDFGDGSQLDTREEPCHTYAKSGTYTVRLTVDDGFKPQSDALLTGMTPANYEMPSGWELVRTQDFESGSVASDEMAFGSITGTMPYSGQRSLQGRVWKDDCATGWKLTQGVATADELYISWYEYMEDQGRMNDEMFLIYIRKNWAGGGIQGERWQWLNNLGDWNKAFNIRDGNLIFFCEGSQPGTTGSVAYYDDAVWRSVGFGKWQQWEVYWRSNTPGRDDGLTQIYLDGVKITEVANTGFSGTLDMTGPGITLGGTTYTKIIWGSSPKPSTVCAKTVQDLTYSINRPKDFSEPCLCPEQCPPNGYVPIFNRFVDDIIILQRDRK
jgi:PKD repeat protein